MQRILQPLLSALFWSYLALSSAFLWAAAVVIWVLSRAFDRRARLLHRFTCWWAYHYVQLCPFWKVRIEGRERIRQEAQVLVANHQSMGDILVLFGLKRHFKWVSKEVVFKVPFIGWNMRMNRYVRLRRGDKRSIAKMMRACEEHLRAGSSVMLFPEGTRSMDGELKAFRSGAFRLAVQGEVPVLPIVVEGTRDALPKKGWVFRNGRRLEILVRVLEPVFPGEGKGDPEVLKQIVRERIDRELAFLRGRTHAGGAPREKELRAP